MNTRVPNIYHAGFLPPGIEASKLHRWSWCYLHHWAEAPWYKEDAPDIFLSDTPIELIDDDDWISCRIIMDVPELDDKGEPVIERFGYEDSRWKVGHNEWSALASIYTEISSLRWQNGKLVLGQHKRKGFVCLSDDIEACYYARKVYHTRSIVL